MNCLVARAPDLAAAVFTLAMAAVVLRAGFRKPANQAFAFFMVLIAGNFLSTFLVYAPCPADGPTFGDPSFFHGRLWERVAFQFNAMDPAALLAFVLLYPRRDPRLDRPLVLAAIVLPPLAFTALHLAAPWMFLPPAYRIPGDPPVPAGLATLPFVLYQSGAYVAALALLIRNLRAERSDALETPLSMLILGVGVAVVPRIGLGFGDALISGPGLPWIINYETYGFWTSRVAYLARYAVPTLVVLAAFWAFAVRPPAPMDRRRTMDRTFRRMAALIAALASLWVLGALLGRIPHAGAPGGAALLEAEGLLGFNPTTLGSWVFGLRWVLFALIVGYALLRYQVLDVGVRFRQAAQVGAAGLGVLATMLAALAVAGLAGPFLARLDGPTILGVAAAAGLAPLAARWASDQAGRRLERSGPPDPMARKIEVYRASLTAALRDGRVPTEAEPDLRRLRQAFGLTEEQHGTLVAIVRQEARGQRVSTVIDGRLAGRYLPEGGLGRGAHGRCTLATDVLLGRQVVIKEVPRLAGDDDPGGDEPAVLREARAASRLNHPNIVTVFDVFDGPGAGYLVMEHLEGGNLRRRLGRGPLPRGEAVRLTRDVLAGLAAAHARGIVHGDIKPENVLLTADGRGKLADFGSAHDPNPRATLGAIPSRAGPGTLLYQAPEQVRGEPASVSGDLYAAAAVACELLTGRHPVEAAGKDDLELREAIAAGVPPDTDLGLPAPLAGWLRTGLARDPRQRWASAEQMDRALEEAAAGLNSRTTPAGAAGTRRTRRGTRGTTPPRRSTSRRP